MPRILQTSTIQAASAPCVRHPPNHPCAPIPAQQKKAKAAERQARQEDIDKHFNEWLEETLAKANALVEKFDKKPRYFLDLFFQGGVRMVHSRTKKNPHNAFLSLKARELRDEGEVQPLIAIQSQYSSEYDALGQEEREEFLREYKELSSSAMSAPCIAPRSSVQDFANTVRNITMLINGLKLRVGVEGFFCIVRNTTAYHHDPQWFFTSPELENYMKLASKKWDSHNVGTKLEAFAISGCDPVNMCTTSKKKADYYKAVIREKIQALLIDITGNPLATMQYSRYEQDIVQRYGVSLEGWTYQNLVNPSELSTSLAPLRELHNALTNGTCKFVKLTAAQKKEHVIQHQAKIASGELVIPIRKKRKDAGKPRKESRKRTKIGKNDSGTRTRKEGDDSDESDDSKGSAGGFKSRSVVDSDVE